LTKYLLQDNHIMSVNETRPIVGRKGPDEPDHAFTPDQVREQLGRVLTNPDFPATDAQRAFLQYVVEKSLSGQADEIKGYAVATDVFGRGEDFDQATDPIVSIQANKLRRALERYYLTAGRQDSILIEIPKGTYVPSFSLMWPASPRPETGQGWPSVLVRPFRNLTGDPSQDFIAQGLVNELALELSLYQHIRVSLDSGNKTEYNAVPSACRFVIGGVLSGDREHLKITVSLTDTETGHQVWANGLKTELNASRMVSFQEEAAQRMAACIASEQGVICRTISRESRHKPASEMTTYEAILRYYQFDLTHSPESFVQALRALEHAVTREPDCGQAWTMLARLYITNRNQEMFDIPTPYDQALDFAEKGAALEPDCQQAHCVLSFVRLAGDDLVGSLNAVEQALAINPHSLYFLGVIGYLLILLGQWERGTALVKKAVLVNPHNLALVHYGLWLDWFRRAEYEQALAQACNLKKTGYFWHALTKAATLGQMGRIEQGREAVQELLRLKPGFRDRGLVLIGYFIKFPEILDSVTAGLRRVGLELADAPASS
jgi:adenylate cyclase